MGAARSLGGSTSRSAPCRCHEGKGHADIALRRHAAPMSLGQQCHGPGGRPASHRRDGADLPRRQAATAAAAAATTAAEEGSAVATRRAQELIMRDLLVPPAAPGAPGVLD